MEMCKELSWMVKVVVSGHTTASLGWRRGMQRKRPCRLDRVLWGSWRWVGCTRLGLRGQDRYMGAGAKLLMPVSISEENRAALWWWCRIVAMSQEQGPTEGGTWRSSARLCIWCFMSMERTWNWPCGKNRALSEMRNTGHMKRWKAVKVGMWEGQEMQEGPKEKTIVKEKWSVRWWLFHYLHGNLFWKVMAFGWIGVFQRCTLRLRMSCSKICAWEYPRLWRVILDMFFVWQLWDKEKGGSTYEVSLAAICYSKRKCDVYVARTWSSCTRTT